MRSVLFLIIVLTFFGCLGLEGKPSGCPFYNGEMESQCDFKVDLVSNGPGFCKYVNYELGTFDFIDWGIAETLPEYRPPNELEGVKLNLENNSIEFEELDLLGGAVYYSGAYPSDDDPRLKKGVYRKLLFMKGDALYEITTISFLNSTQEDLLHCFSKDGMVELAKKLG